MRSHLTQPQKAHIRIVIALKRNKENIKMLNLIAYHVGGKVKFENKKDYEYVVWIAQTKEELNFIFKIFNEYPFLTARKICQLHFAIDCISNKYTYDEFVKLRNRKYQFKLTNLHNLSNLEIPSYFPSWLSGFIEGEGNFSLVFNEKNILRKSSFSIGQNDELHLLMWIRDYFKGETKILKDKPKKNGNVCYYRLYLYNQKTRIYIFDHFFKYPL